MQSFVRHSVLKESAGQAGMFGKPPKKVAGLAADNRSDKCTGGLKTIQRVMNGPITFSDHLLGERA